MTPNYSGGNLYFGVQKWGGHELGTTAVIYKNNGDSYYTCKFLFSDDDLIDKWNFGKNYFTFSPLTEDANVFRVEGKYNEIF